MQIRKKILISSIICRFRSKRKIYPFFSYAFIMKIRDKLNTCYFHSIKDLNQYNFNLSYKVHALFWAILFNGI